MFTLPKFLNTQNIIDKILNILKEEIEKLIIYFKKEFLQNASIYIIILHIFISSIIILV